MRVLFLSLAILSFFSTTALAIDSADEKAIKDRINDFKVAWEKDDAKAMSSAWTEDATLINPFGRKANGRAEMEKIFVDEHATIFKGTTYEISDVTVQSISADVAVADVSAKITGIHKADGSAAPDFEHHVVWVLVKKDGQWMGAAGRPYQFSTKPGEAK